MRAKGLFLEVARCLQASEAGFEVKDHLLLAISKTSSRSRFGLVWTCFWMIGFEVATFEDARRCLPPFLGTAKSMLTTCPASAHGTHGSCLVPELALGIAGYGTTKIILAICRMKRMMGTGWNKDKRSRTAVVRTINLIHTSIL